MIIFTIILIIFVFLIALWVFFWSLLIRRLHDLNHSGWFALLYFIPFANLILLLYLFCARGDAGPNTYGEPNVGKPFWRSLFNSRSPSFASVPTPPIG